MRCEQVKLDTRDKQQIDCRYYQNSRDIVLIISHGFYNSKEAVLLGRLAQAFGDEYDVFMFDFRGHGRSSGFFTWTSREYNDTEAVLSYLKGKYRKMGIIAFSIGASIWINTLKGRNDINSLVCVSAPSDMAKIDYAFWALNWNVDIVYTLFSAEGRIGKGMRPGPFWLKKEKPAETAPHLMVPTLYIHGDRDWVVRPWHSKLLFDRTKAEKKLVTIKGGPHAEYLLRKHTEEFIGEINNWFAQTLK